MKNTDAVYETRMQSCKKLDFYIRLLTDKELRSLTAFARGLLRGRNL